MDGTETPPRGGICVTSMCRQVQVTKAKTQKLCSSGSDFKSELFNILYRSTWDSGQCTQTRGPPPGKGQCISEQSLLPPVGRGGGELLMHTLLIKSTSLSPIPPTRRLHSIKAGNTSPRLCPAIPHRQATRCCVPVPPCRLGEVQDEPGPVGLLCGIPGGTRAAPCSQPRPVRLHCDRWSRLSPVRGVCSGRGALSAGSCSWCLIPFIAASLESLGTLERVQRVLRTRLHIFLY